MIHICIDDLKIEYQPFFSFSNKSTYSRKVEIKYLKRLKNYECNFECSINSYFIIRKIKYLSASLITNNYSIFLESLEKNEKFTHIFTIRFSKYKIVDFINANSSFNFFSIAPFMSEQKFSLKFTPVFNWKKMLGTINIVLNNECLCHINNTSKFSFDEELFPFYKGFFIEKITLLYLVYLSISEFTSSE